MMRARSELVWLLLILGLHITGFAAGTAIILPVLTKANVELAAAQPAILGAGAAPFDLVAQAADIILGHRRQIIPISVG
jgi:hypothetical protein